MCASLFLKVHCHHMNGLSCLKAVVISPDVRVLSALAALSIQTLTIRISGASHRNGNPVWMAQPQYWKMWEVTTGFSRNPPKSKCKNPVGDCYWKEEHLNKSSSSGVWEQSSKHSSREMPRELRKRLGKTMEALGKTAPLFWYPRPSCSHSGKRGWTVCCTDTQSPPQINKRHEESRATFTVSHHLQVPSSSHSDVNFTRSAVVNF